MAISGKSVNMSKTLKAQVPLQLILARSGVATLLLGYGGVADNTISESVSIQQNVAQATPTISESVAVDKDKVAQATQTITESVQVTVT
jgi:hypothetical protein